MSNVAPYAGGGSIASVADPRSLVLHLEVCRLQAELERLEARLADLRTRSTPDQGPSSVDGSGRGVEPADDLLDRMVATLLESGRAEIADVSARRHAAAEAGLDADRTRAGALVDAARAELDAALAERGGALRTTWARGLDEVDLVVAEPLAVEPVAVEPLAAEPLAAEHLAAEPAPVDAALSVAEPVLLRAAEVEEARTDAAFDAWMAVGPESMGADAPDGGPVTVVAPDAAAEDGRDDEPGPAPAAAHRHRSRWLLPLEVVGALLVAAILVVLVLVLVG